jgi:hypothetical protein
MGRMRLDGTNEAFQENRIVKVLISCFPVYFLLNRFSFLVYSRSTLRLLRSFVKVIPSGDPIL